MPTIKKRLNITLSKELDRALGQLAKRDQVPRATKAAGLIELALELEEDQVWGVLAQARERDAKFISHQQFWKHALAR